MVINVFFVGIAAGILALGGSPDGVSEPAEYLGWAAGLAEANPFAALAVAVLVVVVVLFGKSSDRGLWIGERRRR